MTSREEAIHKQLSTSLDFTDDARSIIFSFPSKEAVAIAKENHIRSVYDRFETPIDDLLEQKLFNDIDIVICTSATYHSCISKRKVVLFEDDISHMKQYASVISFSSKNFNHNSVRWSTNKICNYNCPGCIQGDKQRLRASDFTLYDDKSMIESAKLASKFEIVNLIGGEPTLYDLPRLLKYVDFTSIKDFEITSNGSAEYSYLHAVLGLDEPIRLSLSFHTYHDDQKWLDKVKRLTDDFGNNRVQISILPTSHNIDKLKSLNFYDIKVNVHCYKNIFYFDGLRMEEYLTEDNYKYATEMLDYFRNLGNTTNTSVDLGDIFKDNGGFVGYALDSIELPLIEDGHLSSACGLNKDGKCISYRNCACCLCKACGNDL